MKRREFIGILGGAAAVWSATALAQPNNRSAKVGYLGPSSLSLERAQVDALRQRLHELGHVEAKDITYVFRWAEGHDSRLPALAAELVSLKPDIIVTTGTPGTLAVKRATTSIPIVFAFSANPVSGLVNTYSRPGGNVTGFTILGPELEGKRVQLIKELVTGLSRIAIMWNPSNPGIVDFLFQTRAAAAALNLTVKPVAEVVDAERLKDAFAAITEVQPQALVVIADRFLLAHRAEIVNFAAAQRLPTIYPYRGYVEAGGLVSYAPVDVDHFRRAPDAVDKILRGARPGELPVEEPVRFELVINLKAAKALGLEISPFMQQRADALIE